MNCAAPDCGKWIPGINSKKWKAHVHTVDGKDYHTICFIRLYRPEYMGLYKAGKI